MTERYVHVFGSTKKTLISASNTWLSEKADDIRCRSCLSRYDNLPTSGVDIDVTFAGNPSEVQIGFFPDAGVGFLRRDIYLILLDAMHDSFVFGTLNATGNPFGSSFVTFVSRRKRLFVLGKGYSTLEQCDSCKRWEGAVIGVKRPYFISGVPLQDGVYETSDSSLLFSGAACNLATKVFGKGVAKVNVLRTETSEKELENHHYRYLP
jgi:hypothetical protein